MGNYVGRLRTTRFLGQAVCESTAADPRHMEHNTYTFWTGEFVAVILNGLKCSLIAPQFPIYEEEVQSAEPEGDDFDGLGNISSRTEPDGRAQGVYVDIAIVMPIVEPRPIMQLGSAGKYLAQKTLHHFFDSFLPQRPHLSPRFLRVSEFHAPLLGELKPGPTRHPKDIQQFYGNLTKLLDEATAQARGQALCLFSSWKFASQDRVLLLAGAGSYYMLRYVSREWAAEKMGKRLWGPALLKALKGEDTERFRAKGVATANAAEEEEFVVEDGDWTAARRKLMYGSPLDALQRKEALAKLLKLQTEQRSKRRLERERVRHNLQEATDTSPNYEDYSSGLFTDEALNNIDRCGNKRGIPLFETNMPEIFFDGAPSLTEWTGILRLGSDLSDLYMQRIQVEIRRIELVEEGRRKKIKF
ncbi:hypothetical protein B0H15DRAFT_781442 [Mycena belliarum]|uniref:Uncharacterized protein n=1 Tax=Mycena belliarum TaxID=1033014 RepID=A0AAD6U1W8_9AGAR|nr:hypothetical protein B0H15DRAFT_781442 [Mycena belliae]